MSDGVPEVYADAFNCGTHAWGTFLMFGCRAFGDPNTVTPGVFVRIGPHMAKALAIHLARQVQAYEKANGPINMGADVLEAMKIANEDWKTFGGAL